MKIEDIKSLLEEIGLDEDGYGYIDCSTSTGFTDDDQYKRIIAALKQNIEVQKMYVELTKKLEEVESQGMQSLLRIEQLQKKIDLKEKSYERFLNGIREHLETDHIEPFNEIRVGDYIFHRGKDGARMVFKYDPIKEVEPIELKLKVTENSVKGTKCPICNKSLGKYPAISRQDNKTKICSNCGTLEALAAFKESLKDDKTNEHEI